MENVSRDVESSHYFFGCLSITFKKYIEKYGREHGYFWRKKKSENDEKIEIGVFNENCRKITNSD
jgi:hypothetical protein